MGTHPIFESDFDCLTENRKMVNHVEYDPNFRTHKHIDKFAARGMLVDIQRDAAKKETEWEMRRAQRREYEKDMPRDNDYFRKMYMDRDEIAEPEIISVFEFCSAFLSQNWP